MREILFRGKIAKEAKDFFYGHYYEENGKHYIANGETGAWIRCFMDPKTIGQYTGLDDKNGKRIFQGDIVNIIFRDGSTQLNEVCYVNGRFSLVGESKLDFNAHNFIHISVIGNIYDNPELMEARHG
jgi:hypothetical protein